MRIDLSLVAVLVFFNAKIKAKCMSNGDIVGMHAKLSCDVMNLHIRMRVRICPNCGFSSHHATAGCTWLLKSLPVFRISMVRLCKRDTRCSSPAKQVSKLANRWCWISWAFYLLLSLVLTACWLQMQYCGGQYAIIARRSATAWLVDQERHGEYKMCGRSPERQRYTSLSLPESTD